MKRSIVIKTFLEDKLLSWKAKGILSWLFNNSNNCYLTLNEIRKSSKDGIESTTTGINELIKSGYIKREIIRKEKIGIIVGYKYILIKSLL